MDGGVEDLTLVFHAVSHSILLLHVGDREACSEEYLRHDIGHGVLEIIMIIFFQGSEVKEFWGKIECPDTSH